MSNRLGGKQGTSYLGTNANQPPNMHYNDRPPTTFDKTDCSIGDFWIDSSAADDAKLWVLVSLEGDAFSKGELAHWVPIYTGAKVIDQIDVDGNNPVYPLNNVLDMYGVHGITTNVPLAANTVNIGIANTITLGDLPLLAPGTAALTLASGNIAFTNALFNIGIGTGMLAAITTGRDNVAIGIGALAADTTGFGNQAIGGRALQANTTGNGNVGIGDYALTANNIGSNNYAIGNQALTANTSGDNNIAIGTGALIANTTSSLNIALGNNALGAISGGRNIAIGSTNGQFLTGASNVAVGVTAMNRSTTAQYCTALGDAALYLNTTGNSNTGLGRQALNSLLTGSYNVGIGDSGGINYTGAESNNIAIATGGVTGDNNTIRIGATATVAPFTAHTACYIGGIRGITTALNDAIPVLISSTGQLGTVSSSRKYKENIHDLGFISNSIYNLRPVRFNYKSDKTKRENYGLIAEEVEEKMSNLVIYNSEDTPETVRYMDLIPLMLNEMIKLNKRIQSLEELYGSEVSLDE